MKRPVFLEGAKLPLRIPFRRILTVQEGAAGKACFAEQSNELFVSRTLPLNTTQTGFFRHPISQFFSYPPAKFQNQRQRGFVSCAPDGRISELPQFYSAPNTAVQSVQTFFGYSSAQIALRYLVQNKIAVIPKSVHQERMKQNLAVFDFEISREDMKKIEKLDGGKTLFGWY